MTIRSLALATALLTLPIPATAQMRPTTLMSGQIMPPKPEATGNHTTDRVGQRNKPIRTRHVSTPKDAPGWHIPLPTGHRGR